MRYSLYSGKSRFIWIVSVVSFLGMVFGVACLITVLSIMNGFAAELTGRLLSLTPHGRIYSERSIDDFEPLKRQALSNGNILAAEPYVERKILFSSAHKNSGAVLTGIDPANGIKVYLENSSGNLEIFNYLQDDPFKIVLGASLARKLGVFPGDSIQVTVPHILATPLGLFPRIKSLQVVGLFEIGAQPDSYQSYVSLETAQLLFGLGSKVDGVQILTDDLYNAASILKELKNKIIPEYRITSWEESQGSLFAAIRMEKILIAIMLFSVIFVAAFNVVSTLAISVSEKKSDIAVFRTMGMESSGVAGIFVTYGMIISLLGILLGVGFGVILSLNISSIVNVLESLLRIKIFDPSVYFISEFPSRLMILDIFLVSGMAFLLSFFATLYPSNRAAKILPSEVLRYE
ncbi:MAG: lipoprotein-releasing ABC transporter permease subunit [Halieaceae bacterium]|nr:lipoprotein-releasing ABC transporter permease subunit [Halieaceae bacterium]